MVISMCYLVSLTGINIIDVMNIVGSFFNLAVGIYFPVPAADPDPVLHPVLRSERRTYSVEEKRADGAALGHESALGVVRLGRDIQRHHEKKLRLSQPSQDSKLCD